MATIEEGFEALAGKLGAIARQIEDNGPDMAEAWVGEHHDPHETRELLVVAMILYMDMKHEGGEAPPA